MSKHIKKLFMLLITICAIFTACGEETKEKRPVMVKSYNSGLSPVPIYNDTLYIHTFGGRHSKARLFQLDLNKNTADLWRGSEFIPSNGTDWNGKIAVTTEYIYYFRSRIGETLPLKKPARIEQYTHGGELVKSVRLPEDVIFDNYDGVAYDGEKLYFACMKTTENYSGKHGQLWSVDRATLTPELLYQNEKNDWFMSLFNVFGNKLLVLNNGSMQLFDLKTKELTAVDEINGTEYPAVVGDKLYVNNANNDTFYCVDIATGEKTELDFPPEIPTAEEFSTHLLPYVIDGKLQFSVFCALDGSSLLYAYDPATGITAKADLSRNGFPMWETENELITLVAHEVPIEKPMAATGKISLKPMALGKYNVTYEYTFHRINKADFWNGVDNFTQFTPLAK